MKLISIVMKSLLSLALCLSISGLSSHHNKVAMVKKTETSYKVYRYSNYDKGWGCAYRSTQTVLQSFLDHGFAPETMSEVDPDIEVIRETLNQFYKATIERTKWLEPHDTHVYLNHLCGAKGELYTYNGVKPFHSRKAKKSHEKKKSLLQYKNITRQNLEARLAVWLKSKKIPVVIDDGLASYVLLDYFPHQGRVVIGDPHYMFGSELQRKAKVGTEVSIYSIPYDFFINKKWMMLFYNI